MNYTNEQLKEFCVNHPKLVVRKESTRYPGLFVLKYSRKVFYDRLFSKYPILEMLRGLVVDADYNIVSRPFLKIMNYLEEGVGAELKDDDLVYSTRKVNGFMATVKNHNGKLLVSTTGSLDSDFVDMAMEYVDDIDPNMLSPYHAYMFEICHPNDPHIVPEKAGAYLLAVIDQSTGLTLYSHHYINCGEIVDMALGNLPKTINIDEWRNPRPIMRFGDLKAEVKECQHEGFVITPAGADYTFKWKSPYYLVLKMFARKADILTLQKDRVDEEYYGLISDIRKNATKFNALSEQDRLQYMREFLENNNYF